MSPLSPAIRQARADRPCPNDPAAGAAARATALLAAGAAILAAAKAAVATGPGPWLDDVLPLPDGDVTDAVLLSAFAAM
jgi:hypothetical protein